MKIARWTSTSDRRPQSNWLPTVPERRFFLLGRFYGPKVEIVNGSFELNDIQLID